MTWAVEWRSTLRPSSVLAVTMATRSPSCSGAPRSASTPFTTAATAALARLRPMEAARSAAVEPSGRSREESSGRRTFIVGEDTGDAMGDRFEYRNVGVDGDSEPIIADF